MTKTKPTITHEELISQIKNKGWQFIAGDDSHPTKDGTLEDMVKLSHQRHQNGKHPGSIKEIETTLELDMIQLEKLWQYLGLPN